MARTAKGWTLGKRKPHHVRFTYQGHRYDITTGSSDPREAAERAARIYSDVIEGRLGPKRQKVAHPGTELSELCTMWIEAIAPELGPKTPDTYTVYAGHWIRHFGTLGNLTEKRISEYPGVRLRSVLKETVVKELSALGRFAKWLKVQGHIAEVPPFPELGKRVLGTKHKQGRSIPGEPPTHEQVEAILADMTGQAQRFHRALYETALRPQGTLRRLVPADLTPFGLRIRKECEKSRKEAVVPISAAAREALAAGLPFTSDHSDAFYAACKRVFGEDCPWTPYDLKHSRITQWLDAGMPIGGVSYNTRVSVQTLTKRYAHATRRAGEFVLGAAAGAATRGEKAMVEKPRCEGGDLNPHGSYPASTSSKSDQHVTRGFRIHGTHGSARKLTFLVQRTTIPQATPALVRVALWRRAVA